MKNPGEEQFIANLERASEKRLDEFAETIVSSVREMLQNTMVSSKPILLPVVRKYLQGSPDSERATRELQTCFEAKILNGAGQIQETAKMVCAKIDAARYNIHSGSKYFHFQKFKIVTWYRLRDVGLDFVVPALLGIVGMIVLWANPDMSWLKKALPKANVVVQQAEPTKPAAPQAENPKVDAPVEGPKIETKEEQPQQAEPAKPDPKL